MWRQQFAKRTIKYGAATAATALVGYAGYSYLSGQRKQLSVYSRTVYADPLETPTPPGMRPHA
ncbi:hypothetical protein IWW36_005612, partial [Coemansia brasiliensis]